MYNSYNKNKIFQELFRESLKVVFGVSESIRVTDAVSGVAQAPSELKWFGAGYLPEWGPGFTGMNNSTLLLGIFAIAFFAYAQLSQHKRVNELHVDKESVWPVAVRIGLGTAAIGYITWLYGTSFPIPGLILVILVAIYHTVTQKTRFGRYIYAVGGNKNAAALSGVNVQKTYFLTMLNMSFLAALAGIMFVGRSTAAGPSDGTGWEMDAIASVYIGGAPASNQPVTFTDVQLGTWYYDTVAWVSENGITNGLGNGTFGVDAACTRCQVVTFLYAAYSN